MPPRLSLTALLVGTAFAASAEAQMLAPQALPPTSGESAYSDFHSQIGSDLAHAAGYTGRGASVAVLDTGLQRSHIELSTQVIGKKMYDASRRRDVAVSDEDGHGTFVAGVVAGSTGTGYSYGVAPDARILPIKVFSSTTWDASAADIAAGLKKASSNRAVSVINLSLAGETPLGPTFESALSKAVKADKLIVAAAGNSAGSAPMWPARYAKETWANGQIIAVGAVDANNRIAYFSNRAGDTANWFLVAPGVDIVSAYNDGGYGYMSGTSASTPMVSGAAALLEGAWPQLRAKQVAAILLETATDLGDPGVDAVYGRGLLNVARAMQPIGSLSVPVQSSTKTASTTASGTGVVASVATWSGLRAASLAGRFQGIVVDQFNRDFAANLGAGIRAPAAERIADTLAAAARPLQLTEQRFADGSRLLAVAHSDAVTAPTAGLAPEARPLLASSATFRLADGRELAFASGTLAGNYFGLAQTAPQLANPWLGLARASTQFAIGAEFGKLHLRTGILAADARSNSADVASQSRAGGQATVGELDYALGDDTTVGLQWAEIAERGAFLGATAGDAMGVDGAQTRSISAWASHRLGDKLLLAAQYSVARTGDGSAHGLIRAFEGVRAEAFTLGLIGHDTFIDNDRLALTLCSPMRITDGSAQLAVPVDVAENGETVFESRRIALAAASREMRLGLHYETPLSPEATVTWVLELNHNSNHVPGETDQRIAAIFRKHF